MLGEIYVTKTNGLDFVAKEEQNAGLLNIFDGKKLIDSKSIDVNWIVYLTYSSKHSILLGSGYGEGEVFSIGVAGNKFTDSITILKEQDNTGKESRSHSIVMDRRENYAYSANLGLDKIFTYKISNDGLKQVGSFSLPNGTGPRHIAFNKNYDIMYVISEISNEMFVFEQNVSTGELKLIEQKNLLPDGFSGVSYGGTLVVQDDNRYLLGNNRGANTVAVFEILFDGKIEKVADLDYKLFDFYKAKENVYGL